MVKIITYICFKNQILMEAYVAFKARHIFREYDVRKRKEVAIEAPPEIHTHGWTGLS